VTKKNKPQRSQSTQRQEMAKGQEGKEKSGPSDKDSLKARAGKKILVEMFFFGYGKNCFNIDRGRKFDETLFRENA
jgi:hypothetical protein